ncbi:MAG: hypothetical protein U0694_13280 [Anaerolineae bacterium]
MWNSYWTFLDYLELRRRVEKRLARGTWLLAHSVLFVFIAIGAVLYAYSTRTYDIIVSRDFVYPVIGYCMALWSIVLAAHGLYSYNQSGAATEKRSQAIETEMREQVYNEDAYIGSDTRDLYRLHGLLDSDIRKRANTMPLLLIFTLVNVLVWGAWAFTGAHSAFAWETTWQMVLFIFLPLLGWSAFQRQRHEIWVRKQIEGPESETESADKKKHDEALTPTLLHLSDDGEVTTMPDDQKRTKRKEG